MHNCTLTLPWAATWLTERKARRARRRAAAAKAALRRVRVVGPTPNSGAGA